MSIVYSQEYLQSLQNTQRTSASFLEINDIVIDYESDWQAFEAAANMPVESGTAWYYDPVRNAAGDVMGMDYVQVPTSVENPPAVINSNASRPVFTTGGERVRVNGSGGGTRPNVFSKGAKILNTQIETPTLASKLGWAIAAVSMGTKLGKAIDRTLYESGAGWNFDPDLWKKYVDTSNMDDLSKAALRILFGIDSETGNVTPYLNSDALGAMYLTLLQSGAYGQGIDEASYTPTSAQETEFSAYPNPIQMVQGSRITACHSMESPYGRVMVTSDPNTYIFTIKDLDNDSSIIAISAHPFTWAQTWTENVYTAELSPATAATQYITDGGLTFYYASQGVNADESIILNTPLNYMNSAPPSFVRIPTVIGTIIYDGTIAKGSGMDGVTDDTTGATYIPTPDTITGTDLDTVNQQLRQNYPQLYDGEIYEDVPQPDGTNKRITYIPVPFPNTQTPTQPITGTNHQNNPTANPTNTDQDELDDIIQLITDILTPHMNPNPTTPTTPSTPDTGTGDSPPVVIPTGSASSLWAIYNPTQAQVDAFGGWLWSSNFVEQLKKLFADPMQAIIGIHKVFATPSTGETRTIVCGYIDSQVPSKIVTSQYTDIDCGSVDLREYFGNVFDYSPFTEVSLYLPFIGIVRLDVSDVMRSKISITYHVDVLTGACLADVIVTRDNSGGVLYQYSGSAIVTYPISSGSYASAVGGILSIAGGIAATVMTGGAAAPAVLGAAAGLSHLHTDVQKSGSFTGAAGAMGAKKPYLIISRPQTGMPSSFAHLQGYPVNYYTKLGDCSGHIRVSDVQVKGMNATDTELDMIRDALLQGVEI